MRVFALLLAIYSGWSIAESRDAQRHDVQIVTTDDSDTTRRIIQNLRKTIPSARLISQTDQKSNNKNTIFITIGPSALRSLLSHNLNGGVVISAYTSSQAYHSIMEGLPAARAAAITAVYAEPSPAVQFQLISMLYKKPVSVAVLLNNKATYAARILQRAALLERAELTVENYVSGENLNRILNRVAGVNVILATPDHTVYNSDNIRNILITTYRRNQPVIGFSVALVKAGALASSYSDIEDINAQVADLIADFEVSGKLDAPQFPKYFGVAVNDDVARSLNIVVDDSVKNFSHKPAVRP